MRVLRTAAEEVPAAAFDERRQQYRGDLADVRQKSAVISLFRCGQTPARRHFTAVP
jgi:hypothetical protein